MTPPLRVISDRSGRECRQGEDRVRSRAGGGSFYFRSIPLTASAFAQKTLGFCDSPSRGEWFFALSMCCRYRPSKESDPPKQSPHEEGERAIYGPKDYRRSRMKIPVSARAALTTSSFREPAVSGASKRSLIRSLKKGIMKPVRISSALSSLKPSAVR